MRPRVVHSPTVSAMDYLRLVGALSRAWVSVWYPPVAPRLRHALLWYLAGADEHVRYYAGEHDKACLAAVVGQ